MAADSSRNSSEGNIKDTIESILVAFILAFVFRAFVVEAFVIPTGSMAPTLYGAHMRLKCPDCGYTYDVNYPSTSADSDDPNIPSMTARVVPYHCPNCGYITQPSNTVNQGGRMGRIADEPVRFGDRILVLKYLYLFQDPARWDVVVFKAPVQGRHEDANDLEYGMNYIKRLVGKPNESVVILDGAVYTGPTGADVQWGDQGQIVSGADQFKIQRRPQYVQNRLWRTVYDNDYLPHMDRSQDATQQAWAQPWTRDDNGSGWNLSDEGGHPSRSFRFDSATGSGSLHFDSSANPDLNTLTDWLAYDQHEQSNARLQYVADLKLDCFYTRKSGDGAFELQLTKRDTCFTAKLTPGHVALYKSRITHQDPLVVSDEVLIGKNEVNSADLGKLNVPAEVELENVDYQVSLSINGKKVISTTDAEYSPDVPQLFEEAVGQPLRSKPAHPQVRIVAEKQSAAIEHVSLSRNIYYSNDSGAWETFWASPHKIVHLGPGEYFVLGDNSAVSADARFWHKSVDLPAEGLAVQDGRVPERFMLGKAFYVYWPAGYRPTQMLPFGLVPDFGEMRFIH